jgi:ribosomal protein S6--L-glutamate ligase
MGLLVQEFIPPQNRRDMRVLVVGGRVAGAMELEPRDGDFRSNIHLKGKSSPLALEEDLKDLAIRSSNVMGLEISGADIIVDAHGSAKVIEINYWRYRVQTSL